MPTIIKKGEGDKPKIAKGTASGLKAPHKLTFARP